MKKYAILLLISLLLMVSLVQVNASDKITVSSKTFTEQLLLGNMTVMILEDRGYTVEDKVGLGPTSMLRPAIKEGSIDLFWQYTGTTLTLVMKENKLTNSKEAYRQVKDWDQKNNDIIWLEYAPANNTYCLIARQNWAEQNNINTISDLANFVKNNPGKVKMATDANFYERPDGLKTLQKRYDFKFGESNLVFLETGLTYNALKNGNVDVAMGFGTDGRIEAFDLTVLKDDKNMFPVYNPAPIVRKDILEQYPGIKEPLEELAGYLDTKTLQKLNKRVDVDGESVKDVAKDFLQKKGLLD